jgi:protein-S-isoprenylcysteine O-methyltransferase Ste14
MSDSVTLNRISIAGFVLLVCSLAVLIVRREIIAEGLPGLAIQGAAILLMIWARIIFGRRSFHATASPTEGGVVTTGPYHYVRHPIYTAILTFMSASVLTHLSYITIVTGLLAAAAIGVRIVTEERLLIRRFPEYREYASRTKRIVPFVF